MTHANLTTPLLSLKTKKSQERTDKSSDIFVTIHPSNAYAPKFYSVYKNPTLKRMFGQNKVNHFDISPLDDPVFAKNIFQYLEPIEIFQTIPLVSHQFYHATKLPALWKGFLISTLPDNATDQEKFLFRQDPKSLFLKKYKYHKKCFERKSDAPYQYKLGCAVFAFAVSTLSFISIAVIFWINSPECIKSVITPRGDVICQKYDANESQILPRLLWTCSSIFIFPITLVSLCFATHYLNELQNRRRHPEIWP